ncbi:MAG: endonuclease domain-containing protein, partial [Actinomycetota bacterium]|nr:endonuclease domain-containing protein [Actinomycetota bacterium]
VDGLCVHPQFSIETPSQWARVDLADLALRIVIEAEGYETHGTRGGFDNDCARYTALTADGWLVLRFTWTQVMHRPTWVAEQLVRVRDLRMNGSRHENEPGGRNGC